MRASRIIALVVGSLLGLVATVLLISGTVLAGAYAARSDDGFLDGSLDPLVSPNVAVTAEDIDLRTEPGTPDWVIDALDTDVRLRVTAIDGDRPIFVGIAREADLDNYLAGVAHDEIRDVDNDLTAVFRTRSGSEQIGPPTGEDFWAASTSGEGTQELVWEATSGRWAVAVMNADGSPGVAADVDVGIRSAAILPVALGLLVAGIFMIAGAVMLIVAGGRGLGMGAEPVDGQVPLVAGEAGTPAADGRPAPYPLALEARLDEPLSQWMWLLKWLLALPHMLILILLWIAYLVLSIVAGVAILFTGRYPRGIFDFNVGVLRWNWRVSYYAFSGGLGTDRYPPFSLGPEPDYPATLDVEYPERLSRGLVLVKWWLLAIPHYIVVAVIAGGGLGWTTDGGTSINWGSTGGLAGILTMVAAVILLFTGRYPRNLFDLIVGLNRWVYRVVAYASLMTDQYPPFRLDQGGAERGPLPTPPRPSTPHDTALDLPDPPDHDLTDLSSRAEGTVEPAGAGAESAS